MSKDDYRSADGPLGPENFENDFNATPVNADGPYAPEFLTWYDGFKAKIAREASAKIAKPGPIASEDLNVGKDE
jgi:hypothetical protein